MSVRVGRGRVLFSVAEAVVERQAQRHGGLHEQHREPGLVEQAVVRGRVVVAVVVQVAGVATVRLLLEEPFCR